MHYFHDAPLSHKLLIFVLLPDRSLQLLPPAGALFVCEQGQLQRFVEIAESREQRFLHKCQLQRHIEGLRHFAQLFDVLESQGGL